MIDAASKDLDHNGEWGPVIKDALIPLHSIVLPDGKVLAFGTDGATGYYDARFVYSIYDPTTNELKVLPNTTKTNIFCSNMAIDPETGNVIIMGGDNNNTGEGGGTWSGRKDVVIFDYKTQTIRNISETDSNFALHQARWYGTTVTLSNGDILMVGGRDENFNGSTVAEIYNHTTGLRQLTGIDIKDFHDGEGTLTGTYYYPHAWQVSDGSVIMIEAGGTSNAGHDVYRLDVSGNGSYQRIGTLPFDTRNLTGSIMYGQDKVLVASSTGQVWKADLSQPTIKWDLAFAIQNENGSGNLIARTNGTFVMLPDGRVAMVGGSSSAGLLGDTLADAQRSVYFWDPATGKTEFSAKQDLARMYHSSALLLPDGTIYSGGGGSPGPQNNANAQVLAPAYLYDANGNLNEDRPKIVAAPKDIDVGSTFRITMDDTSDLAKITFIKSSGTTHARNADARFLELDYKILDKNTVEVTIPKANVAIPGLWMLFAVDKAGAPSVAKLMGVDMVPIETTGDLDAGSTMVYNIDHEQIDGAFALAVTVRFDDLNGGVNQKIFDLGNGPGADTISLGQVGDGHDIEFVVRTGGQTYRLVARNAIVEGETAVWRVGVDPDGVMRISKDAAVIATGQGAVPADVERAHYLVGESSLSGEAHLIGLVRDLKIANYGHFAELDPSAPSSPCAATGEAVCLCKMLVPNVDDTPGNDAPKVFEKYSVLAGDVSELPDGSPGENKTVLTSTGIIAFADADAEPHTATVAPQGDHYYGELVLAKPTTAAGVKTGSITWTFKVDDAALDSLKEGQSVVQTYVVTIDDGHGGIARQVLSVTLHGAKDGGPPSEDQIVVVPSLATTAGNDAIHLGDNSRLMTGADFGAGANSLDVGNYFELKAGNLNFSNSQGEASFRSGTDTRLSGGDILMEKGGIKNTVVLGERADFSLIKMDGNGAGTVNSITIGDKSKSDAGLDMDGAGTAASRAAMNVTLGDGVKLAGAIDADGAYSVKTFKFGANVSVGGPIYMNGAQDTNTLTAGDGFTLAGPYYGTATGSDTLSIGKDWTIAGPVYLDGGDDTLSIATSSVNKTLTYFYAGAGNDTLILTLDNADLASFETAAKAIGWTSLGNDKWSAKSLDLNWKGMFFYDFETVELKVTGRNEAPKILAADTTKTGAVTETADKAPSENAAPHVVNGTIAFTDNTADTHSVTIVPQGTGYLGTLDYRQPTSAQFGLLPWVFEVDDADLDPLAEGEVRNQLYTVTIRDNKGAAVTETITVTLTGRNDAPEIALDRSTLSGAVTEIADGAPGEGTSDLKTSGSIAFTDVDLADRQKASVAPAAADYVGRFVLGPVIGGAVTWTFQVKDAEIDKLTAKDVLTQSYVVTIDDGHGGKASETVTVLVRGADDDPARNQAPVVEVATSILAGQVTEGTAGSDPMQRLDANGAIHFHDPDGDGVPTSVTVRPRADNYLGAFEIRGVDAGTIGWTFSVVDAAMNRLGAGEQLVQVYDVTIVDARGASTTQAVQVTLTGANDAPVIVAQTSIVSGAVAELPDGAPGENQTLLTAKGSIAVMDPDLKDTHVASVAAKGANYYGVFKLGAVANGHLDWSFSVEDSAIDKLAAGQVVTQSYDVTVSDGHGGTATQTVTVTLTGAADNDAPSNVTVNALKVGAGDDAIVLGDNVKLLQGANFGNGANSLTTGAGFVLSAGNLYLDAGTGPAQLSIGKGANLNGGDIYMGQSGIANSLSIGDDSKASAIFMGGSGAKASQSVTLGKGVVSDAGIYIGGSGTAAGRMKLDLAIGDGSRIGGPVDMGGSYVDKTITLGKNVTIEGTLGFTGTNNGNNVRIGDGLTLDGGLLGSGSGSDRVTIGKDWSIGGTLDLGAGDDSLTIGSTTRDKGGIISGGAGKDSVEFVLRGDEVAAFEKAAAGAGWAKGADGLWASQGKTLTWQGNSFIAFETAKVSLEPSATVSDAAAQKSVAASLSSAAAPAASLSAQAGATAQPAHVVTATDAGGYFLGTDGNDRFVGGKGDNTFVGGKGDNLYEGGDGYDQVDYEGKLSDYKLVRNADGSVTISTPGGGTDTLKSISGLWFDGEKKWYGLSEVAKLATPAAQAEGTAAPHAVTATDAGGYVVGTDGNDHFIGGKGNDTFVGGHGNNLYEGGGGYDQVDYGGKASDYTITRHADGSVVVSTPDGGTDTLKSISGLWFDGEKKWYSLAELAPQTPSRPTIVTSDALHAQDMAVDKMADSLLGLDIHDDLSLYHDATHAPHDPVDPAHPAG